MQPSASPSRASCANSRIAIPEGLDPLAATRALVEGAYIGDFDPDTYRSDRKDQSIEQLNVLAASGAKQAAIEAGLREGVILGEAQNFTRTLVNEPGNVMTPTVLGRKSLGDVQSIRAAM